MSDRISSDRNGSAGILEIRQVDKKSAQIKGPSVSAASLYMVVMASLIDHLRCQIQPWIVDTIPVYLPKNTYSSNSVDSGTVGDSKIHLTKGPSPYDEIFVDTLFCYWQKIDDVRVFDKNGKALVSYISGGAGTQAIQPKFISGAFYLISSVKWSQVSLKFFNIQGISINGNLMATSGYKVARTDLRITLLADDDGTIYFYGASMQNLTRFSANDATTVRVSDNYAPPPPNDYPQFMWLLPELDGVIVWFGMSNNLVILQRSMLTWLSGKTMTDIVGEQSLQSKLDAKVMWNIKSSPTFISQITRRVVTTDAAVLVTTSNTPMSIPLVYASMAHLPALSMILVVPHHSHSNTASSLRGTVIFANHLSLQTFNYAVPQNWILVSGSGGIMNPTDEDGGRRFYVLVADYATQHIHSYYFLVDTCMSPSDSSLDCSACPEGYWRASASVPAPRRCLPPTKFPPQTGMKNTSMTFETCTTSSCSECTYNHAKCQRCDIANGYYSYETPTADYCLKKKDFPARHGLDITKTKAIKCQDMYCTDCLESFEVCVKCDMASEAYLLIDFCVLKSQIPNGQGPNLLTGRVEPCRHPGCIQCKFDIDICENCFVQQRWYLDSELHICKNSDEFGPTEGPDVLKGLVMPCQDLACVNCKLNHKECLECKSQDMFAYQGRCKNLGGTAAPAITLHRFYPRNLSMVVQFDQLVQLEYKQGFFEDFSVVVEDLLESRNYRCESSDSSTTPLGCALATFDNGFAVFFKTEVRITKGRILIYPNRERSATGQAFILDKIYKMAFKDYPITVEGFTSDRPQSIETARSLVMNSNRVSPYLSITTAIASLSVSVIFDRYLVTLEYLSLLEGPLLVYPQQIFDVVAKVSNFLPAEVVPAAQEFRVFRDFSNCQPSPAFARQEFECSVLGNIGADTLGIFFLAVICLLITVVCNKIIDMRIRAYQKAATLEVDSDAPGFRIPKVRKLVQIMHKSNSTVVVKASRRHSLALPSGKDSVEADDTSELTTMSSFLPSGKIDSSSPAATTKFVRICSSLREVYGLSFFLVKLEANQLKLILVIFLNYWNYNYGSLEQYSLIAAIIFTLYYIFQGYFTYQFAHGIWKQVNTKNQSTPAVELSASPVTASSRSLTLLSGGGSSRSLQMLNTLLPEVMSGPNKDIRANLYDGLKVPERFLHLCGPLVSLAKCFAISVLLVMLSGYPSVQVIFAIIVEIAYLVFIIKGPQLASRWAHYFNLWSQCLPMAYLGLKLITTMEVLTETKMQKEYGYWMAWILLVYCITGGLYILYEIGKLVYTKLKSCRKRKTRETPEAKRKNQKTIKITPSESTTRVRLPSRSQTCEVTKTIAVTETLQQDFDLLHDMSPVPVQVSPPIG